MAHSSRAHSPDATRRVEHLSQGHFLPFIQSAKVVIINLGNSARPTFLNGIVQYFAAEYGSDVRFGYLDRTAIWAYSTWSRKHLVGFFKAGVAGLSGAPTGYYLFVNAKPSSYHSSRNDTAQEDIIEGLSSALVGSLFKSDAAFSYANEQAAQRVITAFESTLTVSKLFDSLAALKVMRPKDPYSILGILPSASDTEVKAAYHEKQMRNHPDKVAHLDEEIQAIAAKRSREINEAYQMIMNNRRGRK